MHADTFSSFEELERAKISDEELVISVYKDIEACCTQKPSGFHKNEQKVHHEEVLSRVIAMLKKRFSSGQSFRETIAALQLDEKYLKKVLFHFAGKWIDYEQIQQERKNTREELDTILAIHHGPMGSYGKLYTREELEKKREKKRRKKS